MKRAAAAAAASGKQNKQVFATAQRGITQEPTTLNEFESFLTRSLSACAFKFELQLQSSAGVCMMFELGSLSNSPQLSANFKPNMLTAN